MRTTRLGWLLAAALTGVMGVASAEEITLSTYYPSPRGIYDELRARTLRTGQIELTGALHLNPDGERPPCTDEARGTLWFGRDAKVAGGTVDRLFFCAKVYDAVRWVMVVGADERLQGP